MAISAIASQSAAVRTPPVGLAGLLTMSNRVRSVTSERSSSTSTRNPFFSRMGSETGRAPTKATREE